MVGSALTGTVGAIRLIANQFTPWPASLASAEPWIPRWWLWLIVSLCLLVYAQFRMWVEQYEARAEESAKALKDLTDLKDRNRIEAESKDRDWRIERTALENRCAEVSERLRLEEEKRRQSHPDVILELAGNTTTGTLRLYNRGEAEAFNITLTELHGENGIISWRNPSRLQPHEPGPVTFVIRTIGQGDNGSTSSEQNSVSMVALLLHINYEKNATEDQIANAFQPVKRCVLIRYHDLSSKTDWQTPCKFVYHRRSGSLEIQPGDAVPVPPPTPLSSKFYS